MHSLIWVYSQFPDCDAGKLILKSGPYDIGMELCGAGPFPATYESDNHELIVMQDGQGEFELDWNVICPEGNVRVNLS